MTRWYCTHFDKNYLPEALALHASMGQHCGSFVLVMVALDRETFEALRLLKLKRVHSVDFENEIETTEMKAMRRRVSWQGYVWSVKAALMQHILRELAPPNLIYLDADSFFFGSIPSMFKEIGDADVALTPHRFDPANRRYVINGRYNGGFVYIKHEKVGTDCLENWRKQCLHPSGNPMNDQKRMDAWPGQWGAKVLKHKGVNLAPWNQRQYSYKIENGRVQVDCDGLVFYHFHQGLKPAYSISEFVEKHLYAPYGKVLAQMGGK